MVLSSSKNKILGINLLRITLVLKLLLNDEIVIKTLDETNMANFSSRSIMN